jgi:YVTN family beta-propeller protein
VSGGTRAPTRVSGHQPHPGSRLGLEGTRSLWALVGLLTVISAALALALILDDDAPRRPAPREDASTLDPGARIVGFPVHVGDAPSAVVVGPEQAWVLHEGSGTLGSVDPIRNELAGSQIPIGGRPRYLALVGGSLWVSQFDANSIARVSPKARRVIGRIQVGRSPWGIAIVATSIWVVNHDSDTIQEISTATAEPVGSPIKVGQAPVSASYGYESIWVTNSQDDTVSRVDLNSRAVAETIRVGDDPEGIIAGARGVWVANVEDDTVSRIDPSRNRVVATIPVGDRPLFLRLDGADLWVPNSGDGTLSLIDTGRNRVVGAPLQVGKSVERVGVGFGAIWVTNSAEDTISRVEPAPR